MQESKKSDSSAPIYQWAAKEGGEFKRQISSFRDIISQHGKFQPEANRYHLYVSHACPWAHRTIMVRALKGLENIISVSVVHYLMTAKGWHFSDENTNGCIPDTIYGSEYISELYLKANPEYNARFTVPILWDKKHETIVNNESSEIIRMLCTEFNQWSDKPELELYPKDLQPQIDQLNSWIYNDINNGVYKTGFATSQPIYEENHFALFESLKRVENILSSNEFLVGKTFTEADVRLFTTMVRFDPVYHTHFKCTLMTVTHDFPNILRWMRQIYQMPKISDTVFMDHIKNHYYQSHVQINPNGIVSSWNGPDLTVSINK